MTLWADLMEYAWRGSVQGLYDMRLGRFVVKGHRVFSKGAVTHDSGTGLTASRCCGHVY